HSRDSDGTERRLNGPTQSSGSLSISRHRQHLATWRTFATMDFHLRSLIGHAPHTSLPILLSPQRDLNLERMWQFSRIRKRRITVSPPQATSHRFAPMPDSDSGPMRAIFDNSR